VRCDSTRDTTHLGPSTIRTLVLTTVPTVKAANRRVVATGEVLVADTVTEKGRVHVGPFARCEGGAINLGVRFIVLVVLHTTVLTGGQDAAK